MESNNILLILLVVVAIYIIFGDDNENFGICDIECLSDCQTKYAGDDRKLARCPRSCGCEDDIRPLCDCNTMTDPVARKACGCVNGGMVQCQDNCSHLEGINDQAFSMCLDACDIGF